MSSTNRFADSPIDDYLLATLRGVPLPPDKWLNFADLQDCAERAQQLIARGHVVALRDGTLTLSVPAREYIELVIERDPTMANPWSDHLTYLLPDVIEKVQKPGYLGFARRATFEEVAMLMMMESAGHTVAIPPSVLHAARPRLVQDLQTLVRRDLISLKPDAPRVGSILKRYALTEAGVKYGLALIRTFPHKDRRMVGGPNAVGLIHVSELSRSYHLWVMEQRILLGLPANGTGGNPTALLTPKQVAHATFEHSMKSLTTLGLLQTTDPLGDEPAQAWLTPLGKRLQRYIAATHASDIVHGADPVKRPLRFIDNNRLVFAHLRGMVSWRLAEVSSTRPCSSSAKGIAHQMSYGGQRLERETRERLNAMAPVFSKVVNFMSQASRPGVTAKAGGVTYVVGEVAAVRPDGTPGAKPVLCAVVKGVGEPNHLGLGGGLRVLEDSQDDDLAGEQCGVTVCIHGQQVRDVARADGNLIFRFALNAEAVAEQLIETPGNDRALVELAV